MPRSQVLCIIGPAASGHDAGTVQTCVFRGLRNARAVALTACIPNTWVTTAPNNSTFTRYVLWRALFHRPLDHLTITGGEPFLRADLADIIRVFSSENRTRKIALNTNGDLPEQAESVVLESMKHTPVRLNLQVSIQQPQDLDSTSPAAECLQRFLKLRAAHPRVAQVSALTTVTRKNLPALEDLMERVETPAGRCPQNTIRARDSR